MGLKNYSGIAYTVYHWLARIPPRLSFKTKKPISVEDKKKIIRMLADGYYIILTGNKYHFSSATVKLMTYLKLGRWTKYSHALMNCDFITTPEGFLDFKFMEATVAGVHYSTFESVFDCDSVCLLRPKNMDMGQWTNVIDALVLNNGKPYDDLFQLADESRLSCVELVRNALLASNNYSDNFAHLESLIEKEGNLLPQMFLDCEDFEVVYES